VEPTAQTKSDDAGKDTPEFPWTFDRVKEYTRQNTRVVEIKGQYFLRFVVWAITRLTQLLSWDLAYRMGAGIGRVLHLLKVRRAVAMTNLDIVYGDSKTSREKDEIYKASLINFGRQTVNYMRIPLMDEDFWNNDFQLENEHILRDAYNQGKGVIMLYMHYGPWELPGGKIAHSGYPLAVVAKAIKNKVVDKFVVDARSAMTLGSIKHRDAMGRIREGLNNGEGIIMVIDQNMKRSQGVFVEWMGRMASAVRSVAWLARETGAPVITGYARQLGPKSFQMTMTEHLPWETHEDSDEELLVNTRNYIKAVEKHIYEAPHEWFWLHRRWKIQPEGVPNPYTARP